MHPIGQILNYDIKREFQLRGPEHPHSGFHIVGAPIVGENDDSEVNVHLQIFTMLNSE